MEDFKLNQTQEMNPIIEEAKSSEKIEIPPFFNISPRTIPKSPHNVLEEELSTNPWALLVSTIFLTKTFGKNAKPYMIEFFKKYPTPYDILAKNPNEIEYYFQYLGLKKRGHIIWNMTYQFVSAKWRRSSDLYGIGKYGEDAHRIFSLGHFDIEPSDRFLRLYVDWLRNNSDVIEEQAIIDSESVLRDISCKYYEQRIKDYAKI